MTASIRNVTLLSIALLTACGPSVEMAEKNDRFTEFDAQIISVLLGDQAGLEDKDFAELQASREALVDGRVDEALYEQLLAEKKATVPNMRVEYNIIDAGYYESGGMWHANIMAERKIIIDGTRLSNEGWLIVRKSYDRGTGSTGTYIDDDARQVIMSNLENYTAILRDGTWELNPTRTVE